MAKTPKVIWLPKAADDVGRLRDFLRPKSPQAARRAAKRILQAIQTLKRHPESGRPVESLPDFRDLLISFGAGEYVLRYRLQEDAIVVTRVWHSRESR